MPAAEAYAEDRAFHVRLCTNREATGRHRQDCRRVYPPAQGGSNELLGAVPVPQGKVAVVLGSCGAAVLPLLRLRSFGRRIQLRRQDRECGLSRSGEDCGAEVRDSHAQAGVFVTGGGRRSTPASAPAGPARDSHQLVRGAIARAGGCSSARIPGRARTDAGGNQDLPHWLRARRF